MVPTTQQCVFGAGASQTPRSEHDATAEHKAAARILRRKGTGRLLRWQLDACTAAAIRPAGCKEGVAVVGTHF